MKIFIATLFFIVCFFGSQAQWGQINSITWIPANPTTADTVKLITDCTLGQSGCPLNHDSVLANFPNVDVWGFYCQGMLAVLCGAIDTFNLGLLQAGTNHVRFRLFSDLAGGPCVSFNGVDSNGVDIFVSTFTGINGDEKYITSKIISTGNNSFSIINSEKNSGNRNFSMYSPDGRMVSSKILPAGENKIRTEVVPGIYFYRLISAGKIYYGKLFSE